uniref:Uncharacterized protein n=1 Tax=Kwoniella bestiolae CBS 10118 TaxID=1296100 RepID=A0A1B9GA31_9TREE|nr:hypothetical protein I302_02732 [Kwoniella bestiolae CBS 10118]OCF27882.1 hypothetical protein I302_02732 [Kwoniella bestiolae CBS 10118]
MSTYQSGHDSSVQSLPVFEGLYTKQGKFSISSFFRSSPSSHKIPSPTLLNPLLLITSTSPAEPIPGEAEIIKSLEGLKAFATQFKEAISSKQLKIDDEDVGERTHRLAKGYLAGVYLISRTLWDDPADDANKTTEFENHKSALTRCIQGFFLLYSMIDQTDEIDKHILGSIFPPTETKYHQFSPLLQYPRRVIASLQSQPTRAIAQSKLKDHVQSPIRSSFPEHIPEEEVLYVISLLDAFLEGIQKVESLSGPLIAKKKKQREEDSRRPLRVEMEVRVMRCDLLMSMTTKRIGAVKNRAMGKGLGGVKAEEEDCQEHGSGAEDGDQAQEDIKLSVRTEGHSTEEVYEGISQTDTTRWEDLAEESLVEGLDIAKKLIEEGRGEVLSNHVEAVDWLGQEGLIQPDEQEGKRQSKSPSHGFDEDIISESDLEDDEPEIESEMSEESGSTHPCPLRTLFRLHDRYEEQRLAVWLHLPSAQRGKMGWFMRGHEGRVGSSWDGFGLAAMMEYDGDALMSYGLGADKLEKWVELASMRNAKKIRKRGRKTV